jgi:hypothetical protein
MAQKNEQDRFADVIKHLNGALARASTSWNISGYNVMDELNSFEYHLGFNPSQRDMDIYFFGEDNEAFREAYGKAIQENTGGVILTPHQILPRISGSFNDLRIAVSNRYNPNNACKGIGELGDLVQFSTDGKRITGREPFGKIVHPVYRTEIKKIKSPLEAINLAVRALTS